MPTAHFERTTNSQRATTTTTSQRHRVITGPRPAYRQRPARASPRSGEGARGCASRSGGPRRRPGRQLGLAWPAVAGGSTRARPPAARCDHAAPWPGRRQHTDADEEPVCPVPRICSAGDNVRAWRQHPIQREERRSMTGLWNLAEPAGTAGRTRPRGGRKLPARQDPMHQNGPAISPSGPEPSTRRQTRPHAPAQATPSRYANRQHPMPSGIAPPGDTPCPAGQSHTWRHETTVRQRPAAPAQPRQWFTATPVAADHSPVQATPSRYADRQHPMPSGFAPPGNTPCPAGQSPARRHETTVRQRPAVPAQPRLPGRPPAGAAKPRVPACGIGQSLHARQKPMHLYRRLESHRRPSGASACPAAAAAGAAKRHVPACGIGQSPQARQKPMHRYRGLKSHRRPGRAPGRPKDAPRPIGCVRAPSGATVPGLRQNGGCRRVMAKPTSPPHTQIDRHRLTADLEAP